MKPREWQLTDKEIAGLRAKHTRGLAEAMAEAQEAKRKAYLKAKAETGV